MAKALLRSYQADELLLLVGLPSSDATATFLQIGDLALDLASSFGQFTQMPVRGRYGAFGRSERIGRLGVGRFGISELLLELLHALLQLLLL